MVNTQREGERISKLKPRKRNPNRLLIFFLSPFRSEQESKSNPNHIQNDSSVNGGRGGLSSPIHRNRLNGIIRINITPNPLDEKVSVLRVSQTSSPLCD
jgi:hypothetical protein